MAFLVSFKGQFKPYSLPDFTIPDQVKRVQTTNQSKAISQDGLTSNDGKAQSKGLPPHLNQAQGISSYTKNQDLKENLVIRKYAKDIMSSPVHFAKLSDPLVEVESLMNRHDIRHLPILDNNILVGIISDRDLLTKKYKTTEEVMSSEVLIAYEQAAISELARIMLYEKFSALPIINANDKLVGIVTQSDILEYIVQSDKLDALA